jgi:hypothetical protein
LAGVTSATRGQESVVCDPNLRLRCVRARAESVGEAEAVAVRSSDRLTALHDRERAG